MALKLLFLILAFSLICESVLFSSFWAPIFDRRILNYRVDLKFDPESGKNNRKEYEQRYGYRGEALIADLGKGKVPVVGNNDSNKVIIFVEIKSQMVHSSFLFDTFK